NKLANEGVRAKWMIPSFPTKTFPNHYAIATGLYPEHNGIVENSIYDFGVIFTIDDKKRVSESRWWLGEPIWVTAEKQGEHSAAYFFPGTEAEIEGTRPEFWKTYDGKIPDNDRVDTVLGWLDEPVEKRPQMILMYFSDTDDAGHAHSPDSEEVRSAISREDGAVARLISGLAARGIDKQVNVIIVSDHGMAAVDRRRAILMDTYFDPRLTEKYLLTGEILQIFPRAGQEVSIIEGLRSVQHATCWRRSDIPARLHYNEGKRIAPIVCSADEGWTMTTRDRYQAEKKRDDFLRPHGAHGYDNKYQSMMATFIANGPAFKSGYVAKPFENIQVYNVMCKILGLKPANTDGNIDVVKGMLK
ncbi:MAG: ectonucleotide pyrophosphatase/phosphodiesterase, partial [Pyrinomonadaceae bacterium]